MTFHVGEKVVYPNQGVGTIENISIQSFGARPQRYYLLRLASNHLTVMVPFSHVEDVGLRKVTKNGQVERILRFLADGECKGPASEKEITLLSGKEDAGQSPAHADHGDFDFPCNPRAAGH